MRPEEAFSELVQRGLPEHVALGIVRNLQDESGLDPGINELSPVVPGSRGGFGLAQWTGPRRHALESFAAERGVPASDPDVQFDFLMTELRGPESNAYRSVISTSTPEEAASAFATDFLRPAPQHLDRRVADYRDGLGMDNALAGYDVPQADNALAGYAPPPPQMPQFPEQAPGVLDIAGSYNRGKAAYDFRHG